MRGWTKALLLAVLACAAVGACARDGDLTAPEAAAAVMDEGATPPDTSGSTTHGDSTGRWGGFIGSGG